MMQGWLTRLGYLTTIDGIFGKQTKKNLMAFQRDNSLEEDGKYGPITHEIMRQKIAALPKNNEPSPVDDGPTPWMSWLEANVGEKEIWGHKANPFITELFRYTSLKNHPLATSDETAWCAALACAALEKNGYSSPHSASAKSFDTYGTKLSEPKYGAILTFRREGGSGRHVTFYVGTDINGNLLCIGGNQSNMLRESLYSPSKLVEIRWPIKKQL
jgi:uncharacterized protein (TIGR02594 family)